MIESKEFADLMVAYRHAPLHELIHANKALRDHIKQIIKEEIINAFFAGARYSDEVNTEDNDMHHAREYAKQCFRRD